LSKQILLKRSVIAVALTLATSHVVMAQVAATDATIQKVTVTGSNIKRAAKEGTSPIQTITAKDIKDSGAKTVAELMKQVPSMGSDINQDFTSGSGFAKGVATASLRGLSSTSTLILLNGRRMTPSAYADPNNGNSTLYDLNSIPLSALEKVEILKDGASAVYGSDAIGGVINFITKKNYRGAEFGIDAGMNDDANFKRTRANGFFGFGDFDSDGYNVFMSADVSKRDRVALRDVKDIEYDKLVEMNGRFRSNYSSTISKYAQIVRETAPGSKNFGITRANMDTRRFINLGCPASEQIKVSDADGVFTKTSSTVFDRTFCNYNADQFQEAQGDAKDASGMLVGTLKISDNMSAFSEFAFTSSERAYTGSPIAIDSRLSTPFTSTGLGVPFQPILEIGHPDNPFGTAAFPGTAPARASILYRFENKRGGSNTTNENARALAGLRGSHFGFDWESAVLWNRSSRDAVTYDRLYMPTLRKLNTGTSLATLAADPTITRNVYDKGVAEILQWDAKASTEFGKLPGGAFGLATGVELRDEKIRITPDAVLAAGEIYGLANTVIDGSRKVSSAFIELRAPILTNFEMDFAGRADKYPGLKTNFVPKVGAKWDATSSLSFRSTYSEGFRAPALVQVLPGGSQFFESGLVDPKRCETDEETPKPNAVTADCNKSAAGTGGANPDLKPEKAKSYTLGLIYSPTSNFDVLLDFYRIRKEGEVALGSAFDALKNEDKFPQNIVRDTNPVNFVTDANGKPIPGTGPLQSIREPWINQGATEVSGVDIELKLRSQLGAWGKMSNALRASYVHSYKLAEVTGNIENNVAGKRPGLYDWQLASGPDTPRLKGSFSTSWDQGPHSAVATVNYVGSVSLMRNRDADTVYPAEFCYYGTRKPTDAVPNRNTANPRFEEFEESCKVPDWTTVSVGYTYTGFKNLSLSLNIANIFDSKAPYDPGSVSATSQGYNTGLHNNYGRYFTIGARYTFK
jgi:iron complex outermembrane receptor protein